MNPLIQFKKGTRLFLIIFAFDCLALLPNAQAVSPAPDGCYPNFTTAEGCDALRLLTTGEGNTALGWRSLFSNTTGNFNTGVGGGALALNIGDSNTAVGAAALLLNIPGHDNTAVGVSALLNNFSGVANTAVGSGALLLNDRTGHGAAGENTAVGQAALSSNIDASDNTAVGASALVNNDSTGNAVAINNTAVGFAALFSNTDGASNNAFGGSALVNNTTGGGNQAMGVNALVSNTTGFLNVAIGDNAMSNNVSGAINIALGNSTGNNIVAGNSNIYIGAGVGLGLPDESSTIRIVDNQPQLGGTTSTVFFGGIIGATVGAANSPVLVNANGQLGTAVSSARFKKDIESMGKTSEAIYSLRPVTFHYKGDETNIPCFGLIAEEVAKVNPDLILVDKEGNPQTVRYEQVNAMLLNEFLKEHKTVREQAVIIAQIRSSAVKQEATIAQQQKQIEALTAGLQKVSSQLESSRISPQMVVNER